MLEGPPLLGAFSSATHHFDSGLIQCAISLGHNMEMVRDNQGVRKQFLNQMTLGSIKINGDGSDR